MSAHACGRVLECARIQHVQASPTPTEYAEAVGWGAPDDVVKVEEDVEMQDGSSAGLVDMPEMPPRAPTEDEWRAKQEDWRAKHGKKRPMTPKRKMHAKRPTVLEPRRGAGGAAFANLSQRYAATHVCLDTHVHVQ